MHPLSMIGLLLPALLPRAAANECADARAGLTTWWAANYDLYADDDAGDEDYLVVYGTGVVQTGVPNSLNMARIDAKLFHRC